MRKNPHDKAVDAMAASWLLQREEGLTPEQAENFARWRRDDPRHEAAVRELEFTWNAMQQFQNLQPSAVRYSEHELRAPRSRHVGHWISAVSAAFALAVIAVFIFTSNRGEIVPPPYTAFAESDQRITLADHSVVELRAGSELRVAFTAAKRHVILLHGEANFIVAKNAERPFLVDADTVTVRAIGTVFNVRLDTGAVNVAVSEGRVRVSPPANSAQTPEAASRELSAGERLTIKTALPAASEQKTRDPRLLFNRMPLAEVVKNFNQHNHIQIRLGDAELGLLPVGGGFRTENVEAFVRLLTSDHDIVFERPTPDLIVLWKAK